jgi:hypothetical protein
LETFQDHNADGPAVSEFTLGRWQMIATLR